MFSREEASRIKEEFWTAFGRYMSPVPSAEGLKINWVNYHTRVKDLYFRMKADKHSATVFISLEHRDRGVQELYFEQFRELKAMLYDTLQEEWTWQLHAIDDDGKVTSRIYKEITGVSIFNKGDWGEMISFIKPRMIALDAFWEDARYTFEALKN